MTDLGRRLDVFRASRLSLVLSGTAGGLALLLGVVAAVGLLATAGHDRTTRLVLLGVGFVLVGAVLLLRAAAQGGLRVEAHEGGLVWRRGGRAATLRWDDVLTVRRESQPTRLVVVDRGGWSFVFEPTLARLDE